MPKLTEITFSFKDLLSPDQLQNQRWTEIAETVDQLFEEFVYPKLERNKKLKSFFTAEEQDLENIYIDLYSNLFEQIVANEPDKRLAIAIQQEIVRAKNEYECLYLSLSSLGMSRGSLVVSPLYHPVDKAYALSNLVKEEALEGGQEYFLTSIIEVSLNMGAVFGTGRDINEVTDSIKTVLRENIPEHIDFIVAIHYPTYGYTESVGSVSNSIKIIIKDVA